MTPCHLGRSPREKFVTKLPACHFAVELPRDLDTIPVDAPVPSFRRAFGAPTLVLRYLGRSTHRIAMSNHRLLSFDGERVTIRWKDYAHGNKQKKMTLGSDGVPPPLYPAHPATGLRPHTAIRIPHEHPTVHHAGARPK